MRRVALAFLLLAVPAEAALASRTIEVSGSLRAGEPASVRVLDDDGTPLGGAEVTAVYRPASKVSREITIGTTSDSGSLAWTPVEAGIVTLTAAPAATGGETPSPVSRNLSVLYPGIPWQGLVVLLVAGFILYGGVVRGFMTLNNPPPRLPPDT